MACYQKKFTVSSRGHHQIIDITQQVEAILVESNIAEGQCTVYTPHATAAITINENADPNIGKDFIKALQQIVPEHDDWLHDRIDNNAAAHIKSAVVGASQTIPVTGSGLALGTWQDIFFCEFDGPRSQRKVIVTIVG